MSRVWLIVPLIPVVAGAVFLVLVFGTAAAFVASASDIRSTTPLGQLFGQLFVRILGLFAVLLALNFLSSLLGAFAIYFLTERRNRHFSRQRSLFRSVAVFLDQILNARKGHSQAVNELLWVQEDAQYGEPERAAEVYGVLYLFVTPIVAPVVAYHLTNDLFAHESRHARTESLLQSALAEVQAAPVTTQTKPAKRRDSLLYFILTLMTGGAFWIYWFYVLLKDYNEHFRAQTKFENALLGSLGTLVGETTTITCPQCGFHAPSSSNFCPACGTSIVRPKV